MQGREGAEEKAHTAWSLKVAEYEHQFKTIDEAQKIFVVREMMPKDIKRDFLTGPRKNDEIIEKLEIIVNEMMADDGPVPMDLRHVGTHDTKMTQNDSDTSNDMSYEDVCAIAWKGYKKVAGKKGPNGSATWHRGKKAQVRTAEGGSQQSENHGKQGRSNQPLQVSTSRGGCQGRRPPQGHVVAVTTQEASDGPP